MKKLSLVISILFFFSSNFVLSQVTFNSEDEIVKATDFSIPSSPAFSLLDINPEKINKPGFARDFKLDWFINDYNLRPDIAFEAQPIWLFFYDDIGYNDFKEQKWYMHSLSSLNISLGTVNRDTINSLAYSIKITLFREKKGDPMLNQAYIDKIKPMITQEENQLWFEKSGLEDELSSINDNDRIKEINKRIKEIETLLAVIDEKRNKAIENAEKEFNKTYWNANVLDIGFGQVFDYNNSALDSLDFDSKKHAIWLNGSLGFGKRILISGLYRQYFTSDFNDFLLGANFRYGRSNLNFFVEYAYEKISENGTNTIGYGGEYKMNNNIQLQFGVRTEYNDDFNLNKLIPMVNINWIMD